MHSKEHRNLSNHIFIKSHNLYLSYSKKTEVISYEAGENAVYIIGLCVDSHAEIDRYDIPKFFLSSKDLSIDSVLRSSLRFAGNYVIIADINGSLYAFTDATACLQINYSLDEICISSFDHVVAQVLNVPFDRRCVNIRESSDYVAAMPNDITVYKNIKTVLPNHYFDVLGSKTIRFYPREPLKYFKSFDDILKKHILLIDNIVKEYAKYIQLICPLTSGWDSRVVFAFLSKNIKELKSYTFFHKNFTDQTADLVIPKAICDSRAAIYYQLPDLEPSMDFFEAVYNIIGKFYYKEDIAMAYTYRKKFDGYATINGNIIDHLGKSSLVNLLPIFFASKDYFVAKKRNISFDAKYEVGKYISSIKEISITKQYIYDLFGIEDQCGRWCGYSQKIYAAAGVTLLNIFNCREIIENWVSIPHKDRKNYCIHLYFFNSFAKDLLNFSFNPDEKFKFIGNSKFLFLLTTYARHFLRKWKKPHLKKNREG